MYNKMEPPGGIEPRAVRPTLRTGLEDRCGGRGHLYWSNYSFL